MPTRTASKSSRTKQSGRPRPTNRKRRQDAIAILKADHRGVEKLFKQFEQAGDGAHREKRRLVDQMIEELSKHAAVEEQLVYPWAREYIEDEDSTVLEAVEEHRVVKWVLSELQSMEPDDERFDAKVTVLMELVRHHVDEEESDFFPDLRTVGTRQELLDLGEQIKAAKKTAPTEPDLGGDGFVAAAVHQARDVGKEVVDRIGSLPGPS